MKEKNLVRDFIQARLRERGDGSPFGDAEPLVSAGRLDSVDVVSLAVVLEQNFGVNLAARGFDQNDFDTVENILRLIAEETRAP